MTLKLPLTVATLVLMCQCILPTDDSGQAPVITKQPEDTWDGDFAPTIFSVTAKGADLSYQWQKNGKDISGATHPICTLSSASFADSGSLFRCIVSNSAGSDTSNEALLSIIRFMKDITPPTITLVGDSIVYIPLEDPEQLLERYLDPEGGSVTYSDDADSTLTRCFIQSNVNKYTASPIPYTITYNAVDRSGNEAEVVRHVFVVEPDTKYEDLSRPALE